RFGQRGHRRVGTADTHRRAAAREDGAVADRHDADIGRDAVFGEPAGHDFGADAVAVADEDRHNVSHAPLLPLAPNAGAILYTRTPVARGDARLSTAARRESGSSM